MKHFLAWCIHMLPATQNCAENEFPSTCCALASTDKSRNPVKPTSYTSHTFPWFLRCSMLKQLMSVADKLCVLFSFCYLRIHSYFLYLTFYNFPLPTRIASLRLCERLRAILCIHAMTCHISFNIVNNQLNESLLQPSAAVRRHHELCRGPVK